MSLVEIDHPTRWKKGQSGNPSGLPGKPVGARTAFSRGFLKDLAQVWQEHGRDTMLHTAKTDLRWLTRASTPARSRPTSGTGRSSIPFAIPSWRRPASNFYSEINGRGREYLSRGRARILPSLGACRGIA